MHSYRFKREFPPAELPPSFGYLSDVVIASKMSSNNNNNATAQQQQQQLTTYAELFQQNGGHHSVPMWLIMVQMVVFALLSIFFNAVLVLATVNSKKLHSTCNLLLALDSLFSALFQLRVLITFLIAVFGINFVPNSTCFYLQAVPIFSVLMSFCLLFQIGVERLTGVLFPIWSTTRNAVRFHVVFLLVSVLSNLFLILLCYLVYHDIDSMVMCAATDVTTKGLFYTISFNRSVILHILLIIIYVAIFVILKFKKAEENFSKSISRSLFFLVFVETIGWLPSIYVFQFMKSVNLSPVMTTYVGAGFNTLTCLTASANAPTLYYFRCNKLKKLLKYVRSVFCKNKFQNFGRLYRGEINALLGDICGGIKRRIHPTSAAAPNSLIVF